MDTSFGVFLASSHVSIDATIEPLGENAKHWIGRDLPRLFSADQTGFMASENLIDPPSQARW